MERLKMASIIRNTERDLTIIDEPEDCRKKAIFYVHRVRKDHAPDGMTMYREIQFKVGKTTYITTAG